MLATCVSFDGGICVSGMITTTTMFSRAENIVLQLLQLYQKVKRAGRGTA
jgi:hypothetical protein